MAQDISYAITRLYARISDRILNYKNNWLLQPHSKHPPSLIESTQVVNGTKLKLNSNFYIATAVFPTRTYMISLFRGQCRWLLRMTASFWAHINPHEAQLSLTTSHTFLGIPACLQLSTRLTQVPLPGERASPHNDDEKKLIFSHS